MGSGEAGGDATGRSPRDWCDRAAALLDAGRPDAALDAARAAADRDPASEWAHRLLSLAQERLGRPAGAAAEEALRLAPGSWAGRLRLASALRRLPGRWEEAAAQAELARRFAPEEPGPLVLLADLDLLRGDHVRAGRRYREALDLDPGHPQARVNLGLASLRWEPPRAHHDPAWPVDPRATGRARRALEVWSRQVRLLVAVATAAIAAAALAFDAGAAPARLGGPAVLVALAALTVRQARRAGAWAWVPAMLRRDPWLGAAVVGALVSVLAFTGWLTLALAPIGLPVLTLAVLALPGAGVGALWVGLGGIALLGWPVLAAVRVLAGIWRGRPLYALAAFTEAAGHAAPPPAPSLETPSTGQPPAVPPEEPADREGRRPGWAEVGRVAWRDAGVTLWTLVGRTWSALAAVLGGALVVEPRAAVVALAVPYPLVRACRKARGGADPWLAAAVALVVAGAAAGAAGGALGMVWGWRGSAAAMGACVAVAALRALRAWWRGTAGPWRASLTMCDLPMGGGPPVALDPEVRQAFAYARSVVLSYGDPLGPRVVGAAASMTASGELKLIAGTGAWEAIEDDPRVAVFAADPLQRRFWVEVRGIALADADVLRVTPKEVLVGQFPGRHQRR